MDDDDDGSGVDHDNYDDEDDDDDEGQACPSLGGASLGRLPGPTHPTQELQPGGDDDHDDRDVKDDESVNIEDDIMLLLILMEVTRGFDDVDASSPWSTMDFWWFAIILMAIDDDD